mmetsp:Transcript_59076/g.133611  ORF Transcript_59076/g.133611 Transcript_59076/m.133611 type:complete len:371 (-) Transcript_59076:63-1175(-)
MEDQVASFCSLTGCTPDVASQYLEMCGGNLENAVSVFFESGGSAGGVGGASDVPFIPPEEDDVRAADEVYQEQLLGEAQERARQQSEADAAKVAHGLRIGSAGDDNNPSAFDDMFKLPEELICKEPFQDVLGKAEQTGMWVLVNIQKPDDFSSHILNRDVWREETIFELLQGSFLFWQRFSETPDGQQFMDFYKVHELPHIAIVDPRTGRSVKSWHGQKWKEPSYALEALTDFLDRHTLDAPKPQPAAAVASEQPAKKARSEEPEESAAAPPVPAPHMPVEVPAEPEKGPGVATVSFKLPSGERLSRNFQLEDPVSLLFDVVGNHLSVSPAAVELDSQFPRRSLRTVIDSTVKDADLGGSMVMCRTVSMA